MGGILVGRCSNLKLQTSCVNKLKGTYLAPSEGSAVMEFLRGLEVHHYRASLEAEYVPFNLFTQITRRATKSVTESR